MQESLVSRNLDTNYGREKHEGAGQDDSSNFPPVWVAQIAKIQ